MKNAQNTPKERERTKHTKKETTPTRVSFHFRCVSGGPEGLGVFVSREWVSFRVSRCDYGKSFGPSTVPNKIVNTILKLTTKICNIPAQWRIPPSSVAEGGTYGSWWSGRCDDSVFKGDHFRVGLVHLENEIQLNSQNKCKTTINTRLYIVVGTRLYRVLCSYLFQLCDATLFYVTTACYTIYSWCYCLLYDAVVSLQTKIRFCWCGGVILLVRRKYTHSHVVDPSDRFDTHKLVAGEFGKAIEEEVAPENLGQDLGALSFLALEALGNGDSERDGYLL